MCSNERFEEDRRLDELAISKEWERLARELSEKSDEHTAGRILEALKEYYFEMFREGDLVGWLASLYSPEHGGFYYSNSARDNEGFLPDIESTHQAIWWFYNQSLKGALTPTEFYPEWFRLGVIRFMKERQDKNGYFYHPQWEKSFTDKRPHRRGRDLGWATVTLGKFGAAPTYDTPNGVKGDGLLADGTPAPCCEKRVYDALTDPSPDLVTPELKDKASFLEFLSTLELRERSYHVGNLLESMGSQIVERDKRLSLMGADYSLADILADWLDRGQSPTTGLWTDGKPDLYTVNGLLKISGAYNNIHRPIKYPSVCIKTAIEALWSDEEVTIVCDVLNPWYAIENIIANVEHYSDSTELSEDIRKYKSYIFEHAPEMIRATKRRILKFKKPDGSFSYSPKYCSSTSQGHPVALERCEEGDVNATMISSTAVINHVFGILGARPIPIFTPSDRKRFLNIIEKAKNKI